MNNNYDYYTRFSALQKIARTMTGDYDLRVRFSGNQAYTNGEIINLPMLIEAEDELLEDMRAFVDHETAHCKYTIFPTMGKCKTDFHKYFVNAIEDSRIEVLLPKDFPGTRISLQRLNDKWREAYKAEVKTRPWPVRFVVACRDIVDGLAPDMDEQLELLMKPIMTEIKSLRDCKDTEEIYDVTLDIIEKLKTIRESLADGLDPATEQQMEEFNESGDVPLPLPPESDDEEESKRLEAKGDQNLDPHIRKKKSKKGSESSSDEDDSEGDEDGDETTDSQDGEEVDEADASTNDSDGDETDTEEQDADGDSEGGESDNEEGDEDTEEDGESATDCDSPNEGADSEDDGDEEGVSGKSSSDETSDNDSDDSSSAEDDAEPKQHEPNVGDGGDKTQTDNEQSTENIDWSETEVEEEMTETEADADDSEWKEHVMSSETMIEKVIEEHIKNTSDMVVRQYQSSRRSSKETGVSLPYTKEHDNIIDYTGKGNHKEYAREKNEVQSLINPIVQGLERMLQVEENKRTLFDRERGAINPRALTQVVVAPSYITPFKEDTQATTNNVAVSLVLDCSGSMHGTKMRIARHAAICFSESLQALNIPYEVLGFNTGSSDALYTAIQEARNKGEDMSRYNRLDESLELMIFKSFEEHDTSGIMNARSGGANCDGESILWASQRLEKRNEPRKIMFVLSDGHPVSGISRDLLYKDLRRVINEMPARGMEPFGIGIADDSVRDFYPEYVVVNDINTLPNIVLGQLEQKVIDSMRNN